MLMAFIFAIVAHFVRGNYLFKTLFVILYAQGNTLITGQK